ncbi:MAG: phage tail protein [Burkholderiales bacterium]|nr:phage tail protein [Burkholderiales bacterium]
MDIWHYWGGDLQLSATGDLLTSSDVTETSQRILRGLLTAAPEYVFHPSYGAALGKHVGDALSPDDYARIRRDIRQVVLRDLNVQLTPPPTFDFNVSPQGYLAVSVTYTYKPTGALQTLTFNVTK